MPGAQAVLKFFTGKKYQTLKVSDQAIKTPGQGYSWLNVSDVETALILLQESTLLKALKVTNEKYIAAYTSTSTPATGHDQSLAELLLSTQV